VSSEPASPERDPASPSRERVRARDLAAMKQRGERIAALTCYDHLFARLLDPTPIDVVLVGDSVGNVVLGYDSTLPVTVEEMIHHAAAVRRGIGRALLVVDMPFLSYQTDDATAMRNAGRMLKEAGAEAVKLEGGDEDTLRRAAAMVRVGIPVMGHVGLTPQSLHRFGGHRLRGGRSGEAEAIRAEARALEEAGCFAIVLEMVPSELARAISAELEIPTIGIGAGPHCDGQVLVLPDMLGLNPGFAPRFLRRFADLDGEVRGAVERYVEAVRAGEYPAPEESYPTPEPRVAAPEHGSPGRGETEPALEEDDPSAEGKRGG